MRSSAAVVAVGAVRTVVVGNTMRLHFFAEAGRNESGLKLPKKGFM